MSASRAALQGSRERWSAAGLLLAALAPYVVAAGRALAGGWYPIGDNAFFALRARDVLTEHHPWLGTWTSASLSGGVDLNNPGPVLFDLLALPARIDPGGGVVVAVVVLHASMVVLGGWFGFRRSPAAGAITLAMFAALAWAMGSALLVEPWQPHSLLPAFLCLLVLVWSLWAGDELALPFALGVASLVVQTHLSYAPLVAVLAVFAFAGVVRRGRPCRRLLVAAAAVVVLLWAQPLGEQLAGGRDGNVARIAQSGASGDDPAVGPADAVRIVGSTVASPPFWARPSFGETLAGPAGAVDAGDLPRLAGLPASSAALAGLVALLAAGAVAARRRQDAAALGAVLTAVVSIGAALVTTAVIPVGPLGFGAHQVRWLWPIGIFATGALLLAALRPRGAIVVAAGSATLLGALALPAHQPIDDPSTGPSADAGAIAQFRALAPQLDVLEGVGTVLVDVDGLRLFEPYSTPLMLELQRRGIPFVVDHPFTIGQVGEGRRFDGDADVVVYVADGALALRPRPGSERVAYVGRSGEAPAVGVFVAPLSGSGPDPPTAG